MDQKRICQIDIGDSLDTMSSSYICLPNQLRRVQLERAFFTRKRATRAEQTQQPQVAGRIMAER